MELFLLLRIILIPNLLPADGMAKSTSPHQLAKLTWSITSTLIGDEVFMVTKNHPPYTWWPMLIFDLCQLSVRLDFLDIPMAKGNKLNSLPILLNVPRAIVCLGVSGSG